MERTAGDEVDYREGLGQKKSGMDAHRLYAGAGDIDTEGLESPPAIWRGFWKLIKTVG
jgi:hypothetical protein